MACGSTESRRCSWGCWLGMAMPVATAMMTGGDGSARLRERERERRGRERGERSRGSRGLCGNARGVQGVEAAAGSRRWLGAWPAHDEHAPVLLEEEDDRVGGGGGLGRPATVLGRLVGCIGEAS